MCRSSDREIERYGVQKFRKVPRHLERAYGGFRPRCAIVAENSNLAGELGSRCDNLLDTFDAQVSIHQSSPQTQHQQLSTAGIVLPTVKLAAPHVCSPVVRVTMVEGVFLWKSTGYDVRTQVVYTAVLFEPSG